MLHVKIWDYDEHEKHLFALIANTDGTYFAVGDTQVCDVVMNWYEDEDDADEQYVIIGVVLDTAGIYDLADDERSAWVAALRAKLAELLGDTVDDIDFTESGMQEDDMCEDAGGVMLSRVDMEGSGVLAARLQALYKVTLVANE